MADKQPLDPELVTQILILAIGAAGPAEDPHTWHGRLSSVIPEIVAVLGEGSREHEQVTRMMNCPVLTGKFLGYKLQDSNHRCIVSFQAENRDPEDFWSERTDTPHGAAQLDLLQAFPKGCKVRIWKGVRQISPEKKVRDMLHIQRVDAEPESRQPEPAPPVDPRPAESPSSVPPEEGPPRSNVVIDYAGALERLTGPKRVQLAKWANQEMGVTSLYGADLTDEQKNTILAHCELIAQGMA